MAGSLVSDDELKTLLVDQMELVDAAEFEKAQQMATRLKIPLERALAERGRFPLAFLLAQLAQAWDVGFIELKVGDVQLDALQIIREEYARSHGVVAFERQDRTLKVAMANPRDRMIIREIAQTTKHEVVPYLAPEGAIRRAQLLYKGSLREMLERSALRASTEINRPAKPAGSEAPGTPKWHGGPDPLRRAPAAEASAADLVTRVLEYAVVTRASDVHIEPFELETLVRYRIDGVLHEVMSLPPTAQASLIARIKILSAMRIDEHRIAQDGRFEADLSGFVVDLRVSAMPTQWGEKIVMRVLSREAASADLDDLGLAASDYELLIKSLLRPFRHDPGDGADRVRQVHDPLRDAAAAVDRAAERGQHLDGRGSHRVHDAAGQPDPAARGRRLRLRERAPGAAPAGPRRHHGG